MIKITKEEYERVKKDIKLLIRTETIQMEIINDLLDEREELKKEIERLNGALRTHEILLQSNTKEIEKMKGKRKK